MGKYHLVEADGSGHINKATMKLLYIRTGESQLELIRQHENLAYLEREMEKICARKLNHFRQYHQEPEPIEYEIRDGHGLRFLKVKYKYYEEG